MRGELAFVDDQVVMPIGGGREIIPTIKSSRDMQTQISPQNSVVVTTLDNLQRPETRPEILTPKIRSNTISECSVMMRPLPPLDVKEQMALQNILSPTIMPASMRNIELELLKGKNILKAGQFTRKMLHSLFDLAHDYKAGRVSHHLLTGKVMGSLFFEASTRTSCSFNAAMLRLGGQVVPIAMDQSSMKKGETHDDTVSTLASYCDCLVIRHPQPGAIERFSKLHTVKGKPIINAGDGIGEHPTQALLDIFTIREEIGTVNNLIITIVGDLKNGRTVHSLIQLLALYQVTIKCISPSSLTLPEKVINSVKFNPNVTITQHTTYDDFEKAIQDTDVLYMTRIQRERFTSPLEYDRLVNSGEMFKVTPSLMTKRTSKKKIVVMHPLPRVGEIAPEFDTDPQAAYFRQMENGMFVRMALLASIFGQASC